LILCSITGSTRPRDLGKFSRPGTRFVLAGAFLYLEEQAESSQKSSILAMQRLPDSMRALASDGSSDLMAGPLHEAEEVRMATSRNIFGSGGNVDGVNTPV
jgi:hypothetical protein